ncbi:MAG TPA: response regulator [Opitutus sp.]|nr:response regulator [Opitutus sp.]
MNTPRPGTVFRILVADDLPAIHEDFRKILLPAETATALRDAAAALFGSVANAPTHASFTLDSALQGADALQLVQQALAAGQPYALAFVDMRMPPGWDGIETIRQLWAADPSLQIVLCTAYSDYSWNQTIRALGNSDNLIILKKPFDNVEVLQLAHALTRKWALARENSSRLATLDELVRERTHALRLAEERFTDAFNASPLAQCIVSLDTSEVLEVNSACEKLMGLTRREIDGVTVARLGHGIDPERWGALVARLTAGELVDDYEFVYLADKGVRRNFLCSARGITIAGRPCSIWILRDVTDQLRLEQQLRQSQKLEAVGQLAAGVAHDFNNLLTVIQSYTSFVLDDTTLAEDHRSGLTQVLAASSRAAALTRQLLVFSRRQITKPEPLDLVVSIANLRKMLERVLPEQIRLQWVCPPALPPILADEANLEQVVMNLVVNARDAMPRGGDLTIGLRQVTVDAERAARNPEARAGHFICLSVADTGCGMSPEIQARIFEPFFTTKEVGKGTGLGLSTVYGIVQQHEGWVEVTSSLNVGTTVEVFFPAQAAAAAAQPPSAENDFQRLRGRGEHILLVEDNPVVRDVVRTMIMRAGYRITEADDGPTALVAWETGHRQFDVLLTDMMMPNGYSGTELAARLRQDRPDLKVIVTTGYSAELLASDRSQLGDVPIVLKPYTSTSLLEAIRQVLDRPNRVQSPA